MTRVSHGLALVVVVLAAGAATAQPPPWAGGPPPVGQLFGYSPLVHSIDPFPSHTSGYALSMFGRNGGKRIYPPVGSHGPAVIPYPAVTTVPAAPAEPAVLNPVMAGPAVANPVVWPTPARGRHRFGR